MAIMPLAHENTAHPEAVAVVERIESVEHQIEKAITPDNRATLTPILQKLQEMKYKITAAGVAGLALAQGAAAEMCWTSITDILDGITSYMLPSFLGLVTGAVPLLIVLAVVGFVMKFLDRILEMLSLR
ncbi:MAG: hypothetical protein WC683_04825 [bacterium]